MSGPVDAAHDAKSTPAIALSDVRLTLKSEAGEVNILKGVDLSVARGEKLSVVGPSGSGKTSLLMLLGGLERITSGAIKVAGHDLAQMDEDALARFRRKRVGVVFQAFHLAPAMTALENVATPLELAADPDAFDKARVQLEAVGLGHRLTHYPGQLSGGEQQRVALARAFAGEPELLLADEPTGNLDGETGRKVVDLIFGLTERTGATLVLITHDEGLAAQCDRVIRLADGLIVGDERPAATKAAA
ncbi:MAG: ABC transporter ATP-binding protein [Pseudomonadota bacterium]